MANDKMNQFLRDRKIKRKYLLTQTAKLQATASSVSSSTTAKCRKTPLKMTALLKSTPRTKEPREESNTTSRSSPHPPPKLPLHPRQPQLLRLSPKWTPPSLNSPN